MPTERIVTDPPKRPKHVHVPTIHELADKVTSDVYEYHCLVTNIAGITVQQCNLLQSKVPDRINDEDKPRQLLYDVVTRLSELLQ